MLGNHVKNIIKVIALALLAVLVGEGVLGWGLYWPLLILLLDWEGVYWVAFLVGILISVLNGSSVGPASLGLVSFIGVFSLIFGSRMDFKGLMMILAIGANFVFDRVFGLPWSFWEMIAVIGVSLVVFNWGERHEQIRINVR